jgi:hypothetical protein
VIQHFYEKVIATDKLAIGAGWGWFVERQLVCSSTQMARPVMRSRHLCFLNTDELAVV